MDIFAWLKLMKKDPLREQSIKNLEEDSEESSFGGFNLIGDHSELYFF